MKSKKGEMTTNEILELILGGAIVLVLLVLFYNLIAPNFDRGEETAKSYFESFEEQIEIADGGGIGSFLFWAPEEDDENFFLVYFGNNTRFGDPEKFFSIGENLNHVCICSLKEDVDSCSYCRNLDFPMIKDDEEGAWAIGVGQSIEIKMEGDYYSILENE